MNYENEEEFSKLANELAKEDPKKYAEVISNLVHDEYHDFKNKKYAAPKMKMVADFKKLNRQDIVDRIKNGEFDQ